MSEESNNFINQLKKYNEENYSKDIYVPSLERTVKFSTLTAKHQKDIIHATLDNPLLKLIFHEKVYTIIKELCSESQFVDSFTTFDKDAILLQLRYHYVSKEYDGKDMSPVIEYIKNMKLNLAPTIDEEDGIRIQFKIPSILDERKILKEYSKTNSVSISPSNEDEIRSSVSDVYVMEIIKYVHKVQLIENDAVVDFTKHTYSENYKVVEMLGKVVCDKIHKFINETRNTYKGMYWVDDDTEIEINVSLFN
jgi:hypothetical protein